MSSRAKQKAEARAARQAAEESQEKARRRKRRITQLAVIGGFAVVVAIAAIAISQSGSEEAPSGSSELAAEGQKIAAVFGGIPQEGMTIGKSNAKVKVTEFVDMQCPHCAEFARDALPEVVDQYVRTGKIRMELQTMTFMGPDSERAALMVAAAAEQNLAWNYADLFFAAQGQPGSGYATDEFLTDIGDATPGFDTQLALQQRNTPEALDSLNATTDLAAELGVDSTPSFVVTVGDGKPEVVQLSATTAAAFAEAIEPFLD